MKTDRTIFLVDDDELIVTMLSRALLKSGYQVYSEMETTGLLDKIEASAPDIVLLDINLPGKNGIEILEEIVAQKIPVQVVMLTADDSAETAVKAMKLGAADYLTKPFNMDEVKIVLQKLFANQKLQEEVGYFRKIQTEDLQTDFIGESSKIKDLKEEMKQIAQAGVSTILVTGESGTGKELVAKGIHRMMHSEGYAPFIRVNCAALPETLLETELFGYAKGAFTDAKTNKIGLFELADGGSILLDEIGEVKVGLQSKLLRVLEERVVRRVGGKREIPVNAKVIATTNRNLEEEVAKGEFRLDLFYRLNTFRLHIIPLKERGEDILLIAKHFLSQFSSQYNKRTIKGFSPESEAMLTAYSWPGNVRELKNMIERLVVLKKTEWVEPRHLPPEIAAAPEKIDAGTEGKFRLPETGFSMEDLEKDLILQALEKSKNNKTVAAKLLGISYDTLRYQIKKFGLE